MVSCAVFILVAFLAAGPGTVAWAQPERIDVEVDGETPPAKIAVLKPRIDGSFANADNLAAQMLSVLRQDLLWSRAFLLLDDEQVGRLAEEDRRSGTIDYAGWYALEADYLVQTAVRSRMPDTLEVDLVLHDVRDRRVVEGKRTPNCQLAQHRQVIHRYSDIIVRRCTGKIGIAQTKIAFVNYQPSQRTKEIFTIDYDGWKESIAQVTRYGSTTLFPAWSSDAQCLVYTSYHKGWPDSFIHYLYKRGGTQVFTLSELPGSNVTPVWNPTDPDWLAISMSYKGNPDIYRIRRDGSKMEQLTTNKSIEEAPCFSPNGQEIVFTSDRIGYPQIYVMSSDGTNVRPLVPMTGYACDTAQWSPIPVGAPYGEHKIVFRAYPLGGVRGDLFMVNPDGTGLLNLTREQYDNSNPSWSPDGQYIAFSSTRAGGKGEIWIMEPNGDNPRRLTYVAGQNLSPAWSPAVEP
ncbi:MAG: hypothetical protein ABIH23_15685 [bacterium]